LEQISVCRNNGSHTRPYGIAFDEHPVTNTDSRNVNDGIERARLKDAGRNTKIACTRAVRLPKKQSDRCQTDQ